MSNTCRRYTIVSDTGSCLLQLQERGNGTIQSINLEGAFTIPFNDDSGNFIIQGLKSQATIDAIGSGISEADIIAMIDQCVNARAGLGDDVASDVNATLVQDDTINTVPVFANRVVLSGVDSWTMPANVISLSFGVISSGNSGVTPVIEANNSTTPLFATEQGGWSIVQDDHEFITQPVVITSSVGDIVVINYTTT